ncbi:cyclase family protein [Leptospira borgpetersenii]|uniref:Cyclase n=1 Tax=Leptospira borgpetersenii serovar Javanica str. UI 09931 TaxID=1049767 RepID=A0AAV3J8N7_LEPBO|nr:cyclase family protein [Leptospira borgpetersenii]AXX16230.1 cyclase [Leptospira borgpetersenii serovar Ceylonica]EMO10147.1 putative cyclase [Leptospira borgpetersenii str. Noumea 25]PTM49693.1 kynurenine formamidase [Leptospira borgpetersenii serovar Javanica]EKQ90025.1 putative cyclase [Leptospira borgpetersenii str. UI 09149]EKR00475.1 putative cyclase [Leptospira borgpetersenii serovar Castellonis str. 200801910]
MNYIYLNHLLNLNTPSYANTGKFEINRTRSIINGDTSNESQLFFSNHIGTHIDAPFHFNDEGMTLDEYPANFWVCERSHVIEYLANPGEVFDLDKLLPSLKKVPENTEALILKTGFEKYRESNLEYYCFQNPAIEPNVGLWLRKNRRLKFFGFDYISMSSRVHRNMGKQSHRAFLCKNQDGLNVESDPILLIEDMKLSGISGASIDRLIVCPLLFDRADGSPAIILAKLK